MTLMLCAILTHHVGLGPVRVCPKAPGGDNFVVDVAALAAECGGTGPSCGEFKVGGLRTQM